MHLCNNSEAVINVDMFTYLSSNEKEFLHQKIAETRIMLMNSTIYLSNPPENRHLELQCLRVQSILMVGSHHSMTPFASLQYRHIQIDKETLRTLLFASGTSSLV